MMAGGPAPGPDGGGDGAAAYASGPKTKRRD